jgi:hypothetical protein
LQHAQRLNPSRANHLRRFRGTPHTGPSKMRGKIQDLREVLTPALRQQILDRHYSVL